MRSSCPYVCTSSRSSRASSLSSAASSCFRRSLFTTVGLAVCRGCVLACRCADRAGFVRAAGPAQHRNSRGSARTGTPSGAPTPSLPEGGAVVSTPARSCAPSRTAWCRVHQPRSPLRNQAGIEPDRASVLQQEQQGRRYPAMARAASITFQRHVLVQRRSVGRRLPSVNDRIRPGHRSAGKIPGERPPGRPAPPRGTFFSSCCCRRGV
jgi:hypothetical protein